MSLLYVYYSVLLYGYTDIISPSVEILVRNEIRDVVLFFFFPILGLKAALGWVILFAPPPFVSPDLTLKASKLRIPRPNALKMQIWKGHM